MKSITFQEFNENYQDRLKRKEKIFDFDKKQKKQKKDLEKITKTFRIKNLKNRKRIGFKSIVFRLQYNNSAESIKLVPQ